MSTERTTQDSDRLLAILLGRLDVLGEVQPLGPADALITVELELMEGRSFQVLGLDQLIEVKSFVGRPKDRIVEMELRAIRERRKAMSAG